LENNVKNTMKKLGFGFMRLPLLDKSDQTSFDYAQVNPMVDAFIEKGFSYFDTAYVYHNYKSEEAIRKAVVERYPRESFQLATKLPPRVLKAEAEQETLFNSQLAKCGVTFFDYYLVHNLGYSAWEQARQFHTFDFVRNKKKDGKIRNIGLSYHDTPELLDEILTAQPGLDFVQLQINYIDWENPGIQAGKCWEVARKHNLPIIVMEPCKGGNLAQVPQEAQRLMKACNPNASASSWAIRFAANLEGVMMVLSGMSNMEQVLDNISYMDNLQPLSGEEHKIIKKVTDIINKNVAVPCTTCRYCEEGCPQKIMIPDYFALYNNAQWNAITTSQFVYYQNLGATHGKASDCIACGECEKACPQHIKIPDVLKEVANAFENVRLPGT